MPIHILFETSPVIFLVSVTLFGLLIGSFLNVVIYRVPVILKRQWTSECQEWLELNEAQSQGEAEKFNLVVPRSRCPSCGHQITAIENIPILSYLFLRGKCRNCKTSISARYPFVEALTGLLSLFIAWHFGYGWQAVAGLVFTWFLIGLSMIDLDTKLLPDNMTLPLVWLGLLLNFFGVFTTLEDSLLGAVFGYISLWLVFHAFKLLTGKEGMGYGDFKLLAALGAWMGWQMLPLIILLSSFVGAAIGIGLILIKGRDKNIPIPFGPYLAIAGWIAFIWGDIIIKWYLNLTVG